MARHRSGLLLALAAAAIWLILALRSPSLTHHFAPMVIGGSWAAAVRSKRAADGALAWFGGVAIALSAYLILLWTASLQGPPLFAFLPTKIELPVFAVIGATVSGLWQLIKRQRPLADPVVSA